MKLSVLGVSALAVALAMTSCIDDNYNLNDIDTSVRLQVKDLTIPVNLEPIQLSSFVQEGEVLRVLNGEYVVQVGGTFSSGNIIIDPVTLSGDSDQSDFELFRTGSGSQAGQNIRVDVDLDPKELNFEIESSDIPEQILAIEAIYGNFAISMDFEFSGVSSTAIVVLENALIRLPKGFISSDPRYSTETGLISINGDIISGGKYNITLNCSGIDFAASGATFDAQAHTVLFSDKIGMERGKLSITDRAALIPEEVGMKSSYSISDITLDSFSGDISYEITGVDISDVDLSELPDLLTQENTVISIVNPQLYLAVSNPLYTYGLTASTGLSITKHFAPEQGTPSMTYSSDLIPLSNTATSSYLLAPNPDAVKNYLPGYSEPTKVNFTGLSDILTGNGIPKYLSIQLENPVVPRQHVSELRLGSDMGNVSGNYDFLAPLQLNAGSKVSYNSIQDGWADEDLNKLTIEAMSVSAIISTDVPFGVEVKAYPLDKDGKRIPGVEITGAEIQPNANNADLNIQITGEIRNIDGLEIIATGFVPETMKTPILPTQTISCSNIRATVSGYFDTEL